MGITSHRAARVPYLTPLNMKKRVKFARQNIQRDWTQVITSKPSFLRMPCTTLPQVRFSDEKKFSFYNDGPVKLWRKDGQRYKQGFTAGQKKFNKK